jgi:hypothetical protein
MRLKKKKTKKKTPRATKTMQFVMTASENKEQWRKKNGIKDLKEDKVAFTL